MLRILFLTATMQKGGAERVISLLLKQFVKEKDISIELMMLEEGIEYDIPENVNVTILTKKNKSNLRKFIELPFLAWKLRKYITFNKIDCVLSFLYRPNYVNILARLLGSKHKAIINIRSTTSRYKKEGILGKVNLILIKMLYNKADILICNSNGVAEDLQSIVKIDKEVKVIYNPIDLEYIKEKMKFCEDITFNFDKNKKYIISVGRLIPIKRNLDLIHAFNIVQKEIPDLELIFLGDGPQKVQIEEECRFFGLEKKVHLLGNVRNPFYYLARSNLFVLTSEVEGFPNVLIEAMACGVPVISSDCKSGPREILEDGEYGILYSVGDINGLVKAIKYYIYNDDYLYNMRNKVLKRALDFNVSKVYLQFKELLISDNYE